MLLFVQGCIYPVFRLLKDKVIFIMFEHSHDSFHQNSQNMLCQYNVHPQGHMCLRQLLSYHQYQYLAHKFH